MRHKPHVEHYAPQNELEPSDEAPPYLSKRSEESFSNWEREMVASMCLGPSAVAVMKGSEMLVVLTPDSSTCVTRDVSAI